MRYECLLKNNLSKSDLEINHINKKKCVCLKQLLNLIAVLFFQA